MSACLYEYHSWGASAGELEVNGRSEQLTIRSGALWCLPTQLRSGLQFSTFSEFAESSILR